MRFILILLAICALGQQSNTAARNPLYSPGGVACSDTVTTNCTVRRDAAGNVKIGTTVLCAAPVPVSGTTLTLTSAHNGCIINFSNDAAVTVTIPASLPTGFTAIFMQLGAGTVTTSPAPAATCSGTPCIAQREGKTKTAGAFAPASIIGYAADKFALTGDLQQ